MNLSNLEPEVMEKVFLNVTSRDIEKGERCKSKACPIARALNRVLKRQYLGLVVSTEIDILNESGDVAYCLNTTQSIYRFILDFDRNRKVTPSIFPVLLPRAVLKRKTK